MKHTSDPHPHKRHSMVVRALWVAAAVALVLVLIGGALDLLDLRVRQTVRLSKAYAFTGSTVRIQGIGNGTVLIEAGSPGAVTMSSAITEGIRRATLTATASGDTFNLRSSGCNDYVSLGWYGTCDIHVTLRVPAGVSVTAAEDNTNITIQGVNGNHHIQVGNGNVTLQHVHSENLFLSTDNSDLTLVDVSTNSLQTSTNNGKITMDTVRAATLTTRADNGDISARTLTAASVTATTANGKMTLQFAAPPASLTARSDN